jgi:hypothetical protein
VRNRDQWIPISDDGSCAKTENFFLSREVRKQTSMVISDRGSFAKLRIFLELRGEK